MEGLYGGDMGQVRCQAQILLDLMDGASTKSTRSLRAFPATQMPQLVGGFTTTKACLNPIVFPKCKAASAVNGGKTLQWCE